MSDAHTGDRPGPDFQRLRDVRALSPSTIGDIFANRRRREFLTGDRRLFIVAADHAARGALGVRSNPTAMSSRYELLERLAAALSRPGVDGVLGTPDILEDLAILGVLDGKISVGSMNRGGLQGASFEMDDRYTAYTIERIVQTKLDVAKILVRINMTDAATVQTLEHTAHVVTAAADARVPIMLEPFISRWVKGRIVNDLSADAVITSMAIASGLGASSAYTWLTLPVVPEMERVMEASTLPTLLLGGDPGPRPDDTYASWERALAMPGVHGLVAGRTLLYPADGDVDAAVDAAAALVHTAVRPLATLSEMPAARSSAG